jgi:alkyl hydroperoxide reductase subunit D
MNETIQSLYSELLVPEGYSSKALDTLGQAQSRYLKDLKLNVSAVLKRNTMSPKEAYLLALAVAVNERSEVLKTAFEALARQEGADDALIAEVMSCVSLMNANNVLYRFRHYMPDNEYYNNTPAGMRMSIMMSPVSGKEFFELMSLMVSALNGCERCVTSHEASVKQHGADEARIYDAIRLAAVIKSLCVLMQ